MNKENALGEPDRRALLETGPQAQRLFCRKQRRRKSDAADLMDRAVAMALKLVGRQPARLFAHAPTSGAPASRSKRLAALTRLSSEIRRKPNLGRNRCVPH